MLERLRRFDPLFGRDRIVLVTDGDSTSLSLQATETDPAHPDTLDACFAMLCRLTRRLTSEAATPPA